MPGPLGIALRSKRSRSRLSKPAPPRCSSSTKSRGSRAGSGSRRTCPPRRPRSPAAGWRRTRSPGSPPVRTRPRPLLRRRGPGLLERSGDPACQRDHREACGATPPRVASRTITFAPGSLRAAARESRPRHGSRKQPSCRRGSGPGERPALRRGVAKLPGRVETRRRSRPEARARPSAARARAREEQPPPPWWCVMMPSSLRGSAGAGEGRMVSTGTGA